MACSVKALVLVCSGSCLGRGCQTTLSRETASRAMGYQESPCMGTRA